jgi:hypothetical protein
MPSNVNYLLGMDWNVQLLAGVYRPLPIGTVENLLDVIREGVLSEERGDSSITLSERHHESQNVKACCHNDLVGTETDVDSPEKAANTARGDLLIANFARRSKYSRTKASNTRIKNRSPIQALSPSQTLSRTTAHRSTWPNGATKPQLRESRNGKRFTCDRGKA